MTLQRFPLRAVLAGLTCLLVATPALAAWQEPPVAQDSAPAPPPPMVAVPRGEVHAPSAPSAPVATGGASTPSSGGMAYADDGGSQRSGRVRSPRAGGSGGSGGGGGSVSRGGGGTSGTSERAVPRSSGTTRPEASRRQTGVPRGRTAGGDDGRRDVAVPRGSVPPAPSIGYGSGAGSWRDARPWWGYGAWSPWWGYGGLLPGYIYYDPFWWGAPGWGWGGYGAPGYGWPAGGYGYGAGYSDDPGPAGGYTGTYPADAGTYVPTAADGEGRVRLRVRPDDAEVFVDGQRVGRVQQFNSAWQKLRLPAGPHVIEIRKAGFETERLQVIVYPDTTIEAGTDLRSTP